MAASVVPSRTVLPPKNARGRPVTKLCLALEVFRRTPDGRTRDAKAFLDHFFPQDERGPIDRLFVHMPKEIRADLLSNWGIRGKKSALRDDDEKVRTTIGDALDAGDIDATVIEESVTPELLIDWVPLEDWWAFWRGAGLPAPSVRKALALGRELSLFDERWLLGNLKLGAKRLEGTDVICAALPKDQIVAWLHAVHTCGDASPAGLVTALGWDTILTKTAPEALAFALDALAREIGLVADRAPVERRSDAPRAASQRPTAPPAPAIVEATAVIAMPILDAAKTAKVEPSKLEAPRADVARVETRKVETQKVDASTLDAIRAPVAPRAEATSAPIAERQVTGPPNASFGALADLPPMRPPARTLSGVGVPSFFDDMTADVAAPSVDVPSEDPAWAPPRAEPGDMGWDIVHGVQRPMPNNVQPKYKFDVDDEPTREVDVQAELRRT